MFNDQDVLDEGFKPLRKTTTEPIALTSPTKPTMTRKISFSGDNNKEGSEQAVYEASPWKRLEKSMGKQMERSNSFVGSLSRHNTMEKLNEQPRAVVVVDPFSTGAHLAKKVVTMGHKCIRVLSIWDSPVAALIQEGVDVDFEATIQHNDSLPDQDAATNETVSALLALPYDILAVIPGAETGVELADRLSCRMKLRSNGETQSLARRNKYFMGEAVRASGVRAVMQQAVTSDGELQEFLTRLINSRSNGTDGSSVTSGFKCVLKPVQSAGTDDVYLCMSREEAKTAFNRIYGKINGVGLKNDAVLAQEYLEGTEYVVDQVSRDGVHKLVAVWRYDKRSVHGAHFVYFGMQLVSPDSELVQSLKRYADKCLDALGIKQGPSHMEVKLDPSDPRGPCLVEVGSRCHGGEGTWLPVARECVGYTQVDVTLDVYTSNGSQSSLFESIDSNRYPTLKYGMDVDLVSYRAGVVRGYPGDHDIRSLPSFRSISWEVKVGDYMPVTRDCFTRPGCVQLVHENEEQLLSCFSRVHEIARTRLLDYSMVTKTPPEVGSVVVVDPFSTGTHLAAQVIRMGYKLIQVYQEEDTADNSDSGVSADQFNKAVQLNNNKRNRNLNGSLGPVVIHRLKSDISQTLAEIESKSKHILAVIAGTETAVTLAEELSYGLGTRGNLGFEYRLKGDFLEVVRNKFLQYQKWSQGGLKTPRQFLCRTQGDLEEGYRSLSQGGSPLVVVKSPCSLEKEGVMLVSVTNPNDAHGGSPSKARHLPLESLLGRSSFLGDSDQAVILQEFMEGIEYHIDGVSRDGDIRVAAIWRVDNRPINGIFVPQSLVLEGTLAGMNGRDDEVFSLIRKSLQCLGLSQGPWSLEVMMVPRGGDSYDPYLIEVNVGRCRGSEGTWLPVVRDCLGYSQLDLTLNCHLRADAFEATGTTTSATTTTTAVSHSALALTPTLPKVNTLHGAEVYLCSQQSGTILNMPLVDEIPLLPSFKRMELNVQPGLALNLTTSSFSSPGSIQLVHSSRSQLEADMKVIRDLEAQHSLFTLA